MANESDDDGDTDGVESTPVRVGDVGAKQGRDITPGAEDQVAERWGR